MKVYVEIHLQGKSDTVLTALEGIKKVMHSLSLMTLCVKKVDVKHTSAPAEVVPPLK